MHREANGAIEAHQQIPGLLGRPWARRVGGDPGQMHDPGVDLDEEQHVEPAKEDGVDGEKSVAITAFACERMNSDHAGPDLAGVGSRPASRKIFHTVEAAILCPRRCNSPWILRYPHVGRYNRNLWIRDLGGGAPALRPPPHPSYRRPLRRPQHHRHNLHRGSRPADRRSRVRFCSGIGAGTDGRAVAFPRQLSKVRRSCLPGEITKEAP